MRSLKQEMDTNTYGKSNANIICRHSGNVRSIAKDPMFAKENRHEKKISIPIADIHGECIKFIDMFGGIGGFRHGFEKTSKNFKCIEYYEIDKYAANTYNTGFNESYNPRNVEEINWRKEPDFDLLCAGFPCQSFSIAGQRRGFEDVKGTMFFEIARTIREKRPRVLLLENVKGILSNNERKTFTTILTVLDSLGYDAEWQVLNGKNFNIPQNRERVFIAGYLRGTNRKEIFPLESIGTGYLKQLNDPVHSTNRLYDPTGIARTIRSNAGGKGAKTGLYYTSSGIRRLTPLECERLHGFPDGWTDGLSDAQRYKQTGNTVIVNIVEEIAKKLIK